MVKFAHLLVMSVLIIWIAGSGCIGSNSSDVEDEGFTQNVADLENADSDMGLTSAEIQELDKDMAELENLLETASLEEEIEMEIE